MPLLGLFAVLTTASVGLTQQASGPSPASEAKEDAGPWLTVTPDAALEVAAARSRPLLLYFWASWCGRCRVMERTTLPDDRVFAFLKDNVVALAVEADHWSTHELAKEHGVSALPQISVVAPDGRTLGKVVGSRSPKALVRELRKLMAEESWRAPRRDDAPEDER
ncbi:MAG: thioredoxin family protein [Acidobacteriota bacterium]